MPDLDWEQRIADAWAGMNGLDDAEFRVVIDALAAELPASDPVGLFERAGAFDSTGIEDRAVPLYEAALAGGLSGGRRRRAAIQLASSLRNLGRAADAVERLTAELDAGSDELDDAVRAFLALALVDVGREREAVSLLLGTLVPHLPRYQRAVGTYARLLVEADATD